jgi:hypothetical protein
VPPDTLRAVPDGQPISIGPDGRSAD